MALYAGGWCFILLAISYYIVDVRQIKRPFQWLKIYGMNAITAYVLGEVISFRSIVHSLTFGLQNIIPHYYPLILTLGNFTVLFLILLSLSRLRIFIKI